jgi:hypothetical protein
MIVSKVPIRAQRIVSFILDNSLLLLAGAAVAVVWANVDVRAMTPSPIRCTSG